MRIVLLLKPASSGHLRNCSFWHFCVGFIVGFKEHLFLWLLNRLGCLFVFRGKWYPWKCKSSWILKSYVVCVCRFELWRLWCCCLISHQRIVVCFCDEAPTCNIGTLAGGPCCDNSSQRTNTKTQSLFTGLFHFFFKAKRLHSECVNMMITDGALVVDSRAK